MINNVAAQKVIRFTVPGAPVPYLRMTQGQVRLMRIPIHKLKSEAAYKTRMRIQRVLDYKQWVTAHTFGKRYDRSPKKKTTLNVMCYFANKKHPDPENVRKLIQDALFDFDKHVVGMVDFEYDAADPRCVIEIIEAEAECLAAFDIPSVRQNYLNSVILNQN